MDPRRLPGRVAYRPLPILANPPGRPVAGVPRLWPNLSTETQTQIAQILAALIRRVQAIPDTPGTGWVVLISSNVADERLTTAHRAKLAYVYVRQSSVNQVRQHQESTELQYRLVDRAIGLGWPHERVQVIDEDLGKSGAGGVDRSVSTRRVWPATIGTGISCSNFARYSACSSLMANVCTTRVPTTTACCWVCPAS